MVGINRLAIWLWHTSVNVCVSNPRAALVAWSDRRCAARRRGRAIAEIHA
jgi:hypothetical protein